MVGVRGGGSGWGVGVLALNAKRRSKIVAFHRQRMTRCSFTLKGVWQNDEMWWVGGTSRVLEHLMRKLRSVLESNPGKLGSAVMPVTPVSEAGKQLLGTSCKNQFISSLFLSAHAGIVTLFRRHLPLTRLETVSSTWEPKF